jgi:hypothetical protein
MTWKPQILTRNGKPEFAVLPYDQFEELQERLEDAADLVAMDRARREDKGKPTIPFEKMMQQLGLRTRKRPSKKRIPAARPKARPQRGRRM